MGGDGGLVGGDGGLAAVRSGRLRLNEGPINPFQSAIKVYRQRTVPGHRSGSTSGSIRSIFVPHQMTSLASSALLGAIRIAPSDSAR
jgi:hypothetical protein